MGAQNNRFIETVLLSTHNICFGLELRKFLLPTLNYRPVSIGFVEAVNPLHAGQVFMVLCRQVIFSKVTFFKTNSELLSECQQLGSRSGPPAFCGA